MEELKVLLDITNPNEDEEIKIKMLKEETV